MLSPKNRPPKAIPYKPPHPGIYLFTEKGRALYVGRSNNIGARIRSHTHNSNNTATLAFHIARDETGKTKATYKKKGSRSDLLNNAKFRTAFDKARKRIKKMDIQCIEEKNAVRQALLEIYAALQTGAKYNNFDNH